MYASVDDCQILTADVRRRSDKLKALLSTKFKFEVAEFSVEDGQLVFNEDEEFAPVIVENPYKFINFN